MAISYRVYYSENVGGSTFTIIKLVVFKTFFTKKTKKVQKLMKLIF